MRIGIDTGGTFTDAVVVDSGPGGARLAMGKALSTPGDLTAGALAAVEAAAAEMDQPLADLLGRAESIGYATTVGLNALLTGTGAPIGLITGGEPTMATRPMIGRWALAHPVVEVVSIGTGGGSLAWIDPVLGSLRVGPQSAGAQPGPACYRRGGAAPTLTDAAVTLGYLSELG